MGYRYSTEDRIFGGSMSPRLNPRIGQTGLNAKVGPGNMPRTLVRETSQSGCIYESGKDRRLKDTGMKNKRKGGEY